MSTATQLPLAIGCAGQLHDRPFTVLGQLTMQLGERRCDYWRLQWSDDQADAWLYVDEDGCRLDCWRGALASPGPISAMKPGKVLRLSKSSYRILTRIKATCTITGDVGDLATQIPQGATFPYVELESTESAAAIVFTGPETIGLFIGDSVPAAAVLLLSDQAAAEPDVPAHAANGDGEHQIRPGHDHEQLRCPKCHSSLPANTGKDQVPCSCGYVLDLRHSIANCQSCGASMTVGHHAAGAVTCQHCGTIHGIENGQTVFLHRGENLAVPRMLFAVGDQATIEGHDYRITGFMRWTDQGSNRRPQDRYLLRRHDDDAAAWLIVERGHFVWCTEVDLPKGSKSPKTWVSGRSFRFEGSFVQVGGSRRAITPRIIIGETTQLLEPGEPLFTVQAARPPLLWQAEWQKRDDNGNPELVLYKGTYMPREDVAQAFGIKESRLPKQSEVLWCQPYMPSPVVRGLFRGGGIAFIIFFVLTLYSCGSGKQEHSLSFKAREFNDMWVSKPFQLKQAGLAEVEFESSIRNAWAYLGGGLIRIEGEKEYVAHELDINLSYYYGGDWSEGSPRKSIMVHLDRPGTYRLVLDTQQGTSDRPRPKPFADVRVNFYTGAWMSRYLILMTILTGILFLWAGIKRIGHWGKRSVAAGHISVESG